MANLPVAILVIAGPRPSRHHRLEREGRRPWSLAILHMSGRRFQSRVFPCKPPFGRSIEGGIVRYVEEAATCSPSRGCPPSQWKSARTTNAIEHLHEEFKRRIKTQTHPVSAESAAMLFWALLASGQIHMRAVRRYLGSVSSQVCREGVVQCDRRAHASSRVSPVTCGAFRGFQTSNPVVLTR
jgi:hypothetical protein